MRLSLGLLVGAKILNVSVPFLFKFTIDEINEKITTNGGEALLTMTSAPDTVLTVATSLLIGCKFVICVII